MHGRLCILTAALLLGLLTTALAEDEDSLLTQIGVTDSAGLDVLLKLKDPIVTPEEEETPIWEDLFPNINMIGMTYDVFRGNPHPTGGGLDPGWRFEVFDVDYHDNKTIFFGSQEYRVPDGVQVASCPVCSLDFSSTDVMSSGDYANSLRVAVSIGGRFKGLFFKASFKASADFQRVRKQAAESNSFFMESSALCSFYCPRIETSSPPRVTAHFRNAVEALPMDSDVTAYQTNQDLRDAYDKFVDLHGTHFALGLTMGATFGQRYELSESSLQSMENLGVSVKTAARLKSRRTSVGVSTLTETEKAQAQTFASRTESESTFSYGGKPAANPDDPSDTSEWRANARADPLPIRYDLRDIFELLDENMLPGVAGLPEKRALLQVAVQSYCARLSSEFDIVCEEEPEDDFHFATPATVGCSNIEEISRPLLANARCCFETANACATLCSSGLANYSTAIEACTAFGGHICSYEELIAVNSGQCCEANPFLPRCEGPAWISDETVPSLVTRPYGRRELGSNFNDFDQWNALGRPTLTGFKLQADDTIDSIQALYEPYRANRHGRLNSREEIFALEPGEHIVSIDVCELHTGGSTAERGIRSIRFRTNRRESNHFGDYDTACDFTTANFPSRLQYISGFENDRIRKLVFHHAIPIVE